MLALWKILCQRINMGSKRTKYLWTLSGVSIEPSLTPRSSNLTSSSVNSCRPLTVTFNTGVSTLSQFKAWLLSQKKSRGYTILKVCWLPTVNFRTQMNCLTTSSQVSRLNKSLITFHKSTTVERALTFNTSKKAWNKCR